MQILESIHKSLQIIGLSSHQSMQKHPFNARNLISLFVFGLNIICNFGFIVSGQTNDLMAFTDSVYITLTVICADSIFIRLILKMQQLFELINRLEDIMDQSKLNLNLRFCFWNADIVFFSLNPHRTSESNVKNNLHRNWRKNSKIDTNFEYCFSKDVTSTCHRTTILGQYIYAFDNRFGSRCT